RRTSCTSTCARATAPRWTGRAAPTATTPEPRPAGGTTRDDVSTKDDRAPAIIRQTVVLPRRNRHTVPMTHDTIAHDCAACLAMDRADGAEDGWLVPKLQKRVKNANKLVK